jgi:hypothetical protein
MQTSTYGFCNAEEAMSLPQVTSTRFTVAE